MAFQQGLSGLSASSKALDVISNNVANASNIGFKMANMQFADVYAASLNGAAAGVQIGIGTQVGQVSQAFTQGNITPTSNPLDVAINGAGFFRMNQNGSVAYSRNGQFSVDKNGYIVNAQGYRLTGYQAGASGAILPATPTDIYVNTSDLQPQTTTTVSMGFNLDSRNATITGAANAWTGTVPVATNTYNTSTSATVYDSLGNSHIMTMYFRRTNPAGTTPSTWDMYVQMDDLAPGAANALSFDTAGQLTTTMPLAIAGLTVSTGAVTPMSLSLDLTGSSQYGSSFGVNRQIQDGYASGKLSGITIGDDGVIQGRYSNGQTQNLGQVVLANFANQSGLLALGNNLWAESPASGQALVGAPGTGSLGSLTAGAVEESNVDLTSELVNMITAQRNYQANAQSIKTQDQVMQTLVNLR